MNWASVVECMDFSTFKVYDHEGLEIILELYQKLGQMPFPNDALLRKWRYVDGQWSFLKLAVDSEVWLFPPSFDVLAAIDGLHMPVSQKHAVITQNFCSLPLVSALLRVSSDALILYPEVKLIFTEGLRHCPAVLLLSLCLVKDQVSYNIFFYLVP